MKNSKQIRCTLLATALAGIVPGVAFAQDSRSDGVETAATPTEPAVTGTAIAGVATAPVQDDEGSSTEPHLEDIIVQARRTNERQQSVPLAVSTVSNARIEEAAVSSVSDIQRLVPSLQITQSASGAQNFTIRGSFSAFAVDPAVISYIDDVPIDPRTLVYELYDLGSVQQLKGPQGTLFGRNSTGGALLFFTARPSLSEAGGYIQARYGNLDERRIEGALNLPISSTLAVRVAGELERRDGLLKSVTAPGLQLENRHNSAVRASVLWKPSDMIENSTQFTDYNVREHRYSNTAIRLAGPCTGPTTPAVSCLYQPPFNSFLGVGNLRAFFTQQQALPGNRTVANDPYTDDVDRTSVTNSLSVTLGGIEIRNILYYGSSDIGFSRDYDGTPVDVIALQTDTRTKTFYTETYASGQLFADRLNVRGGVVYSRDRSNFFQNYDIFHLPVSATNPQITNSRSVFKSTALYGQGTIDLSDVLKGVSLTAGYRYTWDDRRAASQIFQGTPTRTCALQTFPVPATGPVAFPDTDLASCTRRLRAKFSDSNYNLTVDWKPTDKLLLYAATRKGYKTGSFNLFQVDPALSTYQPEVVKDVELGIKADWRIGGIPFRTNIAAFRSQYTNIQAQVVLINPATGGVDILVLNRDPATGVSTRATIKGFEVEVNAAPARWLELSGFYSQLNAKYDRNITAGVNLAGQNVGGVIPTTWGITAQAKAPLEHVAEQLVATASFYRSTAPLINSTSTIISTGRSQIDARVSLRNVFNSGAELAVFGKNLADKNYCTTNPVVTGELTQTCADPRTYGVELSYRFGRGRR